MKPLEEQQKRLMDRCAEMQLLLQDGTNGERLQIALLSLVQTAIDLGGEGILRFFERLRAAEGRCHHGLYFKQYLERVTDPLVCILCIKAPENPPGQGFPLSR